MQKYERNKVDLMQKTQSTENNPKSIETYVTATNYGTETKLLNKQGRRRIDIYSNNCALKIYKSLSYFHRLSF